MRPAGRSLAHAMAWTAGVKWLGQVMSWAATLVVARLLSPDDYGLVGMAAVYLGLVTILSEFGLSTTIVAKDGIDDDQIAQLNTLSVLVGLAAFALSCLMAHPLGVFFASEHLPAVVTVLSFSFIVTSFRTVPYGLLQRDLRFRRLAVIEGIQTTLLSGSMVLLALFGFEYWTLVIGTLLGDVASTAMLATSVRHRFAWPRYRALKSVLTFSRHLIVGRLAWYTSAKADVVVAGRFLGKAPLGEYSVAFTLASMPLEKISGLVNRVLTPYFAAVQRDKAALRRLLLTLTGLLSLVTFPVALGMMLVADTFVHFALGPKWLGVVGPLRVLCAVAAIRSVVTLLPHVVIVTGGTRLSMYVSLIEALVVPAAFYVGSAWGVVGLSSVWLFTYPVFSLPLYWRVFRRTDLPIRDYLAALWPALSGTALMIAMVLILKHLAPGDWPAVARLLSEILGGALAYGVVMATWHRARLVTLYGSFRALGREPGPPSREAGPAERQAVTDTEGLPAGDAR